MNQNKLKELNDCEIIDTALKILEQCIRYISDG